MAKRILSVLLALIMVLGFCVPTVSARERATDQIYIGEGASMSQLIDSGVVSTGGADLWVEGTNPVRLPGGAQPESYYGKAPGRQLECDCGKASQSLHIHADNCSLKQLCLSVCQGSAVEIAAAWDNCGMPVRNAIEGYLNETAPEKMQEVLKVLASDAGDDLFVEEAPVRLEGEASAVCEDVTVEAVGVPEGSSLIVAEPSDEAVEAVEDYVANVDVEPEQLFLYDISVQNDQSSDWQPEDTSVELTLSLKELNLPKYSVVKIVHVDDEGNVSVMETKVGDEGKIVFETEGFSTFAGFTVDFEYGSAFHSIKGMTSITMSELFDALEMPLYASEVVDVAFSDETLLTVEQIEGDWLLTSLKAFTTHEKLTFTMKDGRVFEITVTDATVPTITAGGVQGDTEGGSGTGNGYVQWKADGDGDLSNTNEVKKVGWSQSANILISGSGTFVIYVNANPGSVSSSTEELHINLQKIQILAGAHLKFYLNGDTGSGAGDESSFGQSAYKHIKRVVLHCATDTDMFQVSNGSLQLEGLSNTRLVLDGADLKGNQKLGVGTGDNHLVYLGAESTGFTAKYVTFRNAPKNAIRARPTNFGTFLMQNCDFESTVYRETYGGAIYVMQSDGVNGNTDYTSMDYFTLKNVDFNGNYAEQGGAIYLRGKIYCINIDKNCSFVDCEAKKKGGGAIYIDAAVGEATINASFKNCKAAWSGGALSVASVRCTDVTKVAEETGKSVNMTTRTNHLILDGARFENCQTLITGSETDGMGGAIHLSAQTRTIDILNCTFTGCSSANDKTNASGGAICFGYYNLVDNFQLTAQGGDSYWTAAMTNKEQTEEWGGGRRSEFYTWEAEQSDGSIKRTNRTTFGTVNITDTTFTNCSAGFHGGAFMIRTGACIADLNCTSLTIDGCTAEDRGSAIFFNNCIVNTSDFNDCVIKNCKITNPNSQFGGTMTTIGTTTTVMTVNNCQFLNNVSYDSGGGLYWNAGNPRVRPLRDVEKEQTDHSQFIVYPKATVSNCLFQGNEATTRYGGGIFTECEMDVIACTFDGNKAYIGGGIAMGVYNNSYRMMRWDERADLVLDKDTSFYNNNATYGGAISIRANATESLVNYPSYPYYDAEGNMVAPEIIHTVTFQLGGAQIYNNSATQCGGGIYYKAESGYADPLDDLEVQHFSKNIVIDDGTIYNNTAGNYGGGIYMSSSENTYITVTDGVIYNNEAGILKTAGSTAAGTILGGDGGGIYLTGKNALVTISGGVVGGYNNAQTLVAAPNIAHGLTKEDTVIGGNGGGIALFGGSRIEMSGGTVCYNQADTAGGGIAVHGGSSMYFSAGTVDNNRARFGGGISISGSTGVEGATEESKKWGMYFDGGTISNNKAFFNDDSSAAYGGGVCLSSGSTMRIDGGTITGNIAAKDYEGKNYTVGKEGGGVAVCDGSTMVFYGGTIQSNWANSGGGIVVRGDSTVTMNPVTKTVNGQSVTTYGLIDNNTADYYGGGIYLADTTGSGNTITINDGTVSNNTATQFSGGGVYVGTGNTFTIKNGNINDNKAMGDEPLSSWGGGVYSIGATVNINGGNIFKNKARSGGGICLEDGSETTISKGVIYSNTVEPASDTDVPRGGGVYAKGSALTISNGEIYENTASAGAFSGVTACGGGVAILDSDMTMEGGTIRDNTAACGGGIAVEEASNVTISGGTMTSNTANGNGGGVYVAHGAVVKITKGTVNSKEVIGTIRDNTAYNGGGVYVTDGGDLTVHEGHITYNKAVGLPPVKTGYQEYDSLKGVGGGICVANDSTGAEAKFTLTGDNMAIYGNLADFAGDDVFANSYNTTLDVPLVASMNLSGYNFKPEGWFEDYAKGDTKYTTGLARGTAEKGYNDENFIRYRSALSSQRVLIEPAYVKGEGLTGTAKFVNKPNTYVAMTLGIPAAAEDTIVVDYDLSVKFDIQANDLMVTETEFANTALLGASKPTGLTEKDDVLYSAVKDLDSTIFKDKALTKAAGDLTFGNATLTGHTVEYVMTTMNMTAEDSFYYVVGHDGPDTDTAIDTYYYAKVTVIPATTLYFEDNCGFVTYSGNWVNVDSDDTTETDVATGLSQFQQNQDRPGMAVNTAIDADKVYGNDDAYKTMSTYSMGSAKKVTVSEGVDATATFTFTGTGFDVISLCSGDTGMVMVDIYRGSAVNDANYVQTLMVDTFYGCTTHYYKYVYEYGYDKEGKPVWKVASKTEVAEDKMGISGTPSTNPQIGDTYVKYQAEPVPDASAKDTLYQIPVIKRQGLDYGTYTVQIYVAWSWWTEQGRPNYESCDFYLDAIRIYDPANNGATSQTVQDAYKADKEGWPVYQELRNMFITQENLTNKPTSGIVFVDGINYSVSNYHNYGANNEVYLAAGESIAFKLNELKYNEGFTSTEFTTGENSIVAAIHIGAKSLKGSGKLTITDGTTTLTIEPGNTDMYYDISSMMNKVVTITNNSSDNPISLTNIKVTHTQDPGTQAQTLNLLSVDDETVKMAVALITGKAEQITPVLTPKYPTLSFEGEIRYNIYFDAEGLEGLGYDNMGLAIFNTDDAEGTVDTAAALVGGVREDSQLLLVSTDGIPAKNLGDKLYFKLYARLEDGSCVYSDLFSYSALEYAKSVLNSSTASVKEKALVAAMLNYGAEAQTYFGYNADALMNSILTVEHQTLLNGFSADSLAAVVQADPAKAGIFTGGGFSRAYPTVSFQGAFQIQYYFTSANKPDSDVTFCFWTEDTYTGSDVLTVDNADLVQKMELVDGEYLGISPEIAAKALDETVYVAAFYESEGETYTSGVLAYSLAAYCKTHAGSEASDMNTFANAAAIYGCAAKSYFDV